MTAPPAPAIVSAFGGEPAALTLLPGGQGLAWRAGPVVLKPATWVSDAELAWMHDVAATVSTVTLAAPVPADRGTWIVDGWAASSWVDGAHVPGRWDAVLDVADRLHAELAGCAVPWLPELDHRQDPWSVAAREVAASSPPWTGSPEQIVHGDLAGNVLFTDDGQAVVIDLTFYRWPAEVSSALVVADAVAWEGAPLSFAVAYLARRPSAGEAAMARAIAFRVRTAELKTPELPARVEAEAAAYAPLLALLPSAR